MREASKYFAFFTFFKSIFSSHGNCFETWTNHQTFSASYMMERLSHNVAIHYSKYYNKFVKESVSTNGELSARPFHQPQCPMDCLSGNGEPKAWIWVVKEFFLYLIEVVFQQEKSFRFCVFSSEIINW